MRRWLLVAVGVTAGAVPLFAGCGSSERPRPDIVFVSSRGGEYAIYGMNADGGREQRLSRGKKGDASSPQRLFFQVEPAWSPDGTRIAFSSGRDGSLHIFVMRADGSGTQGLTRTKRDDTHPAWSPDGRRIAFARGGDIYVMTAAGKRLRRVEDDPAEGADPAWSPDGRWIAYVRRQPGTSIREIWLVHPGGSGRRRLTHLDAFSHSPSWSPDGRTVAFSSDARTGIYEIHTIGVDGKGLRRVTSSTAPAFEPTWSPDGKTILFSRDGAIYAITGGREDKLTKGENDTSPVWRPVRAAP